jgi:hypothetical protein
MQAKNNEADDAGMDGVVQLLFDVIVAEAKFHRAGRNFLDAAGGIDRDALVRRAAELLCRRMTNRPPLDVAEAAIRGDLQKIFGWRGLAELAVGGHA